MIESTNTSKSSGAKKLFFSNQTGKGLKSSANKSRKKSLFPTKSDIIDFHSVFEKIDPLSNRKKDIGKSYEDLFIEWLWNLQLNFNILLFGFGLKDKLLRQFANKCLIGEDVLAVTASSSNSSEKDMLSLLNTIATQILKLPDVVDYFQNIIVYTNFIVGMPDY